MANKRKVFSKIYDQYIDKIYRFIFLKVNSQEIAQDLTSETFLRSWETFNEKNEEIENIQAFLYRVARNLVTDHYREKARNQVVSAEFAPIIDPKQDLEEKSLFNSDIDTVKIALADLKEDYQNVIIWHYLDDLPIQEVSEMMGRTEETTRVLLHRALKSLKSKLNNQTNQPACA